MRTSFELAGRLKASQEIIKADHTDKSDKLWVWILGQNVTFPAVFTPVLIHPSRLSMPDQKILFFLSKPGV